MKDEQKTKEQLLNELVNMRQRVAELEALEAERKQAEEALRENERCLRRQNRILVELARSKALERGDLEAALKEITVASARTLNVARVSVWLYNEERSKIRCIEQYELSKDCHSEGYELMAANYPSYFKALEEERIIAAHDAHTDPRTREFSESYLSPFGITSMLDAPARLSGRMIGVICHEHVGPARRWSLEEQNFAASMADFVSLAIEVEERKRAEEEIRQRTAQLEALRQVGLEITAQLDLDSLLHSIASRAIELVGGMSGGLYLYRPERDVLEWSMAIGPNLAPIGTILHRGEGLSGKVWKTGETIIVDDYRQWEGQAVISKDYPWMAVVGVPVHWGEEFLGVLNVLADPPHTFSQADAELLSLFATQAAIAIRNARLYEEAHSRTERLTVVNHIARAVGTTLQLDDLMETVYREITSVFEADAFFIALYDEEAKELDYRLQVDEGIREPRERRPLGTGLTSLVVTERKPLLIRDMERERDRLPTPHVWGTMKLPASWLGVPMLIGQQLTGVICVQAYRPHAYSGEEQQLLSTIADQVAVAIENARLFEEEKRRSTQLALINDVGDRVASILDLDKLMQEVTHSIQESFNYYSVAFLLLDENCRELVLRAIAGGFEHIAPGEFRQSIDEGIAGFVTRTGQSWLAGDVSKDPYYIRGFPGEVLTKSELCVPVKLGDEVIGVLDLQSIYLNDFDPSDVVAMEAVIDRLAIAIENARLFTQADQRAKELSTMLGAARAVSSTLDLQEVLVLIAEEIVRATGAAGCTLSRWDREADIIVTLTEWRQRRMEVTDEPGTSYALDDFPATRTVLEKRQPISILAKDPDADPAEVALLQKNGAVSLLMLPLVVGEQVIGLVELDESERKREFTAAEIRLCQALADQAAVAIQNARLFQETRQRALQLQTIEEVGRKVSAILDPEELFPHVAKTIQHNFGYYHVDIFLVDQATGYAIFKASSDRVMERVWKQQDLRFKIGEEGMIGWVADMGEPLLANDVSQEPRYLPDNLLLETKSELAVPLKVGERVVGVLDVDSDKPNAFDEDDLFVLQTLANQIAVAIENARLYEAEQQRRRDAEALRETVLALTSALDRNQVIERILAQLQQVVPYDSASVQLLQGNRLVITGGRGFSNLPDLLGISFPADGDNPNREVIRTRAPFIVDDAQSVYEGFRKDPHTQTVIRSWLGVPLLIGEQLVGMIALDKREAGFYTEEHARLAQTFAAQAAIAIENARLFEEVEKRRVYLEGVLGSAPDAIVTLDARHRIVEWNPGAERLFGYSREEAIGQDIDDLVTSPDVLEEAVRFSRMAMSGKEVPPIETIRYRKDDSPVDVIVAGSPISVGDEFIGAVAVYTDITRQKRMEEELRALLLVDELTGLYNRRGFLTLGQQQLRMANRMKRRMLLLFGDYNGLKEINDTFGHPEGDRALIEVAGVLQETFRESDIIARIAGDEFVVLALETVDDSAEILATRLQKNVATRNARGDLRYKLSLSVGVACYDPNAPCSIDELVARADRLMYERKRHEQES